MEQDDASEPRRTLTLGPLTSRLTERSSSGLERGRGRSRGVSGGELEQGLGWGHLRSKLNSDARSAEGVGLAVGPGQLEQKSATQQQAGALSGAERGANRAPTCSQLDAAFAGATEGHGGVGLCCLSGPLLQVGGVRAA